MMDKSAAFMPPSFEEMREMRKEQKLEFKVRKKYLYNLIRIGTRCDERVCRDALFHDQTKIRA
jgi:hypothetical protein